MNYFLDIVVGCMLLAFFDRLLFSCFGVEEEKEERREDIFVEEDRSEYRNVGSFGRTNSDSCIVKIKDGVKRTKTI